MYDPTQADEAGAFCEPGLVSLADRICRTVDAITALCHGNAPTGELADLDLEVRRAHRLARLGEVHEARAILDAVRERLDELHEERRRASAGTHARRERRRRAAGRAAA